MKNGFCCLRLAKSKGLGFTGNVKVSGGVTISGSYGMSPSSGVCFTNYLMRTIKIDEEPRQSKAEYRVFGRNCLKNLAKSRGQ